ncbi:MAG: HIT family protein [Chloroflexota bacterium]|nr:HIT family protein [Chloroflexota bacterium]
MAGRVACGFCDIVAGRVEASRVYEDDFVLAFLDNAPINPGHMLVIPRAHYASLSDLPEAVGQEVFHCHLHVLPRFRGDSFRVGHGSPEGEIP